MSNSINLLKEENNEILSETKAEINKQFKEMKEKYESKTDALEKELKTSQEVCGQLKEKNDKMIELNAEKREEVKHLVAKISELEDKIAPKGDLVIGDSIIRDVKGRNLKNTSVFCHKGAKVKDIAADLDKYEDKKFGNLKMVVGTNDAQEVENVQDIVISYEELLSKAKTKADTVTVSSVCPRGDEHQENVTLLNIGLLDLCGALNVDFVDNDTTFLLRDGTINDAYIIGDGPHLTKNGTNRLARNLKLKMKTGLKDVTKNSNDDKFEDAKRRTVQSLKKEGSGRHTAQGPQRERAVRQTVQDTHQDSSRERDTQGPQQERTGRHTPQGPQQEGSGRRTAQGPRK
jgi:hypothetical protein